jgi:hypothetical protein
VLPRLFRPAWMWSAYWRLYPLWDALRQEIPEIELPPEPGTRWNIPYRLHRRVIEIRDAQLALKPHSRAEIADQAAAAAKSAGLPPAKAAAVVEAAVIVDSLQSHFRGSSPGLADIPPEQVSGAPGNDIHAEVARLILVSQAISRSDIVRRIAGRPPARVTCRVSFVLNMWRQPF